MKLSFYNTFIPIQEEAKYLIYNSVSNALLVCDWELGERLFDAYESNRKVKSQELARGQRKLLLENGVLLKDEVNEEQVLRDIISDVHDKQIKQNSTFAITMNPTNLCNMGCVYCFEGVKIKGMEIKWDEDLIAKLNEIFDENHALKTLQVTWFGGEPLLKPAFIDKVSNLFIEFCKKRRLNYHAVIITNGTLLTREVWEMLVRNKIFRIQVSLDGAQTTHDRRRPLLGGKGTYSKILENLKSLPEEMALNIRIHGDKAVVQSLSQLLDDLESIGIWPQKAHRVGFTMVFKFAAKGGYVEDRELYFEQKEFYEELLKFRTLQYTKYNHWAQENKVKFAKVKARYPAPSISYCPTASNPNSIVIDDEGFVHKCWETVNNKSERLQTIAEFNPAEQKYEKWHLFEKFDDPYCHSCKFFPICEENCTIAHYDHRHVCTEWKFLLDYHLKRYYLEELKSGTVLKVPQNLKDNSISC